MLIQLEFYYIIISVHAQQDRPFFNNRTCGARIEASVKVASDISAAFRKDSSLCKA